MPDGGPVYAETNPDWLIVEPWNGISSLFILLPAIIWLWKIRKEWRGHKFLLACIPFLFLGGLGSTLFHAFRSSYFLLLMDVLPTAILTLLIGIYLWIRVLPHWSYIFLVFAISIGMRLLTFEILSPHTATNINYVITGITLFIPLIIILKRTRFNRSASIFVSITALAISLAFRELDARASIQFLPMGTHFLWHIFSGIGAYFLADYLFYFSKTYARKKPVVTGF